MWLLQHQLSFYLQTDAGLSIEQHKNSNYRLKPINWIAQRKDKFIHIHAQHWIGPFSKYVITKATGSPVEGTAFRPISPPPEYQCRSAESGHPASIWEKALTTASQFSSRLALLFEILYGLAIASGIEAVAPQILKEPTNWLFLWCSSIAIAIAIGDWITYYIRDCEYKNPLRIIVDAAFTILIFFLFPAAGVPMHFLVILSLYFLLSAAYPYLLKKDSCEPWDVEYQHLYIRWLRAGFSMVGVAAAWKYPSFIYLPLLAVSVFIGISWILLWRILRKHLASDSSV